ncbi:MULTISPECIES: ABCB family ABC transporter ATP-binding protein/permease [Shewanella]|jgi:ATP-binding cassette subfamily B protein|uniref:ATP-binding cassette domain-containing protein n=1 Tax=Shewanella chilikensis TaxID=558541 RepID=A0A6G7LNX9_9GAMM|nr:MULTISPECIES: ABC transporter ATP-binding protein/permease [Shewanella]MBZ4678873.1 metal transporter permease [Shewanella sp.]MCE9853297.1 ABC transporter ATP-binding protein/permease [Shewanella chilikensis]MCL1153249.1 ABC transporter ATP-binding protein/permease [Shewanella chilikensis]MCL1163998.1 ABC transporter ATP-binding protein/permease [Shewanella chilikensis]PYE60281.1 ATP-binding cassette subfamily B protein [Shewanella chilikensis]
MRPTLYLDGPVDKLNWQVLKLLWPYLLEYKSRIILALSCLVVGKLASVGLPFLLKHLVDDLGNAQTAQLLAVPIALVLAYGSLRLVNALTGEIRDTLFGRVTERAIRRLGLQVFEHLHRLDLGFHLDRRTGGLSRDIERGTSGISFLMRFMVFNIVPTLLEILMVVAILLWNYGIWFALITFCSVLAYGLFSVVTTEWRTSYVREAAKADSVSNTRAIDSLLNYETVKYFNNEAYEANEYDKALADWEVAKRKNRLSLFALNAGQATIIAIAMTLMLGLAAFEVTRGQMTVGDFVLINAFMMQLFMPLNFLGFVYREIRGALANIERMFSLLDKTPLVKDSPTAKAVSLTEGRVSFDSVGFGYGEREILKGVSFEIEPGQKVAVVGESGAGKSTLVRLLFRFYDVSQGAIRVDGIDIRDMTQDALRRAIAIVPQDTVLFNDTLFENIRYGRPDASDAEIWQAIELAHLKQFVEALPQQAQTKVGERGMKLSGGEKQRVAIARAILKRSPILVFDEATSSLDSRSERAILKALDEVAKGHTSLVIAHRLSTVVDADKILVLHQGQLVESGSHDSLLAADGYYARLWRIQHTKQTDESVQVQH